MNAPFPPDQSQRELRGEASLSAQWSAMLDAGAAVAMLAGAPAEKPCAAQRGFVAAVRDAGGWRLELARDGMADLSAMLQPGLSALLAVKARGHDASGAALTLWEEYRTARDALLTLAPEAGIMGPRRSA